MRSSHWMLLSAATAFIAPASAQFHLEAKPSGTALSCDGMVVHSSTSTLVAESITQFESGEVHTTSWTELDASSGERSYYAIRNGPGSWVVRETTYELSLRAGRFDPRDGLPKFEGSVLASGGNVYFVQYHTQPLIEYSQGIQQAGGEVFDFIERHSHIVRMPANVRDVVKALPFVRAVVPYHPEFRIDPELSAALRAGTLNVAQRYHVQVFKRGIEEQNIVAKRIAELDGTVDMVVAGGFRLDATLSPEALATVVAMDQVRFVDRWFEPEADMDIVRIVGGANHVETTAGFTGQGVRVEVLDTGCDTSHPDFASPITHGSVPIGSHGTCTSGIVCGTGVANPAARGMMPSAQLVSGYYGAMAGGNRYAHTADLVDPNLNFQCVLQSNSWGGGLVTSYTTTSAEMDDIIVQNDILILQSQSNSGSTQSRPEAWAKNIVSIGGIRHFGTATLSDDSWSGASIGPAADSRMKPDLAYFYDGVLCNDIQGGGGYSSGNYNSSFGGTSAATPIAAGHFGLFFQMWHQGVFGNTPGTGTVFQSRPRFTLAKAAMINTARSWDFSGSSHNLSRAKQGFGHASVAELYDRRQKTFFVDQTDPVSNLGVVSYDLDVAAGEPDLRVTLVYRDAMGAVSSAQHRKNDLTLVVTSPDGTVYYGNNGLTNGLWSTSGGIPNTKDTVENVFVQNPTAGAWTVAVRGDNVNTNPLTNAPANSTDFALWATGATAGPECPQPIVYCTAKLTSNFTLPAISFVGVPSAAVNDFRVTLSDALPNRAAILFYGPQSNSANYHDGVLCARAPFTRSSVLQTTAASTAELSIPIVPAMAGATRYYQWWFRDAQANFTDGLSDGLEVTFCD